MASSTEEPEFLILSGGQTGVDRAALDAAAALGLPAGGWIPAGRKAEDGRIPSRYQGLTETRSGASAMRTERNVRDANAVVLLVRGPVGGGTRAARDIAQRFGRPVLELDLSERSEDAVAKDLRQWVAELPRPVRLNVAGPRESEAPGIQEAARRVLLTALDPAR